MFAGFLIALMSHSFTTNSRINHMKYEVNPFLFQRYSKASVNTSQDRSDERAFLKEEGREGRSL